MQTTECGFVTSQGHTDWPACANSDRETDVKKTTTMPRRSQHIHNSRKDVKDQSSLCIKISIEDIHGVREKGLVACVYQGLTEGIMIFKCG